MADSFKGRLNFSLDTEEETGQDKVIYDHLRPLLNSYRGSAEIRRLLYIAITGRQEPAIESSEVGVSSDQAKAALDEMLSGLDSLEG